METYKGKEVRTVTPDYFWKKLAADKKCKLFMSDNNEKEISKKIIAIYGSRENVEFYIKVKK